MDSLRGFDEGYEPAPEDEPVYDRPPEIGLDERRMHVRAYNHWVNMLGGRDYPSIEDLEPEKIGDFGPHGVLLDFTQGAENPGVSFIGDALRAECCIDGEITEVAQVPKRSLLSRLTDHYLQIIANRAPIGFEAEFVSQRGATTLYRGILMPLSSDGDTIDFIYGVINWKELADPATTRSIAGEIGDASGGPAHPPHSPVWADGPSAGHEEEAAPVRAMLVEEAVFPSDDVAVEESSLSRVGDDAGLADRLCAARESADAVKAADGRSRAALYGALGQAYDFALAADADPDDYAEILEDAGLTPQDRAPMTPIVKLIFGIDYDKTRLTEFAAALSQGRRQGLPRGSFAAHLERQPGGLKSLVAAERAARRPGGGVDRLAGLKERLRGAHAIASLDQVAGDGEFVVLLGRREADGSVSVLMPVPSDDSLTDRAIRRASRTL